MQKWKAIIAIIGINPYVTIPDKILGGIFKQSGKDKGPIPVKGTVNGKAFKQTLVKYSGAWRLYINSSMLKDSPKRIGEEIILTVAFDPVERVIPMHPKLANALKENKAAHQTFQSLSPYRQREIIRYIAHLKTEASIEKNITKAIAFLNGKGSFAGRNNN